MNDDTNISRRAFMAGALGTLALSNVGSTFLEPIIDIHQHSHYSGRSKAALLAHQKAMGISKTILLPSGTPAFGLSTHGGVSNGLEAQCGGNDECLALAREFPDSYAFGANEVPDVADAVKEIEKYLKLGAVVIGELKFGVDCDSKEMQKIYHLAQDYDVPVLMHWQFERYNYHYDRFYKVLEQFPRVNFIGHAQTWWANIDKNHRDQTVLYPKTKVQAGGLTDRLLSDYPNMYGDLSAGSGLSSMTRDEDHAKGFLERHQDKLLYGSDCNDALGYGAGCQGSRTIATIRKLANTKNIERKILFDNAKKLFRI